MLSQKKKKCKIFPVFQNRYNKAVQRVLKSIRKKEIGKVKYYKCKG